MSDNNSKKNLVELNLQPSDEKWTVEQKYTYLLRVHEATNQAVRNLESKLAKAEAHIKSLEAQLENADQNVAQHKRIVRDNIEQTTQEKRALESRVMELMEEVRSLRSKLKNVNPSD